MKKVLLLLFVAMFVIGMIAGCAETAVKVEGDAPKEEAKEAEEENNEKYNIALIPQILGNPWYEVTNAWAQEAGKDLGVNVIYTGANTFDAVSQANVVQDLITKGVDAICIAPVDPEALVPILKQAMEAGILVITWDSDVGVAEARDRYVTFCDDVELGQHLMKELARIMEYEGEYAIITSMLTVQNNSIWSESATQYAIDNYPNMKRVAYEPCDDDQAKAYSISQNLITAYPNLKGILGVTTPAPPASAQAVREAGKSGDIKVVGIVEASSAAEYIKDGSMQQVIVWHPGKVGYLTIFTAKAMLDGVEIKDNQQIPKVGNVRIINGNVVMDEILDITIDNIDEYAPQF